MEEVKTEFIRKVIDDNVSGIFRKQLDIATQQEAQTLGDLTRNVRRGSNKLSSQLRNPNYRLSVSGSRAIISANVPLRLRFMDMRWIADWKVYNKVVWPELYGNLMPDLRYGFSDEIKKKIDDDLAKIEPK